MTENLETTEKNILKSTRNKIIAVISFAVIVFGGVGGYIYWSIDSSRIYVENSTVSASVINLSTTAGGILQEVFVNAGDQEPE